MFLNKLKYIGDRFRSAPNAFAGKEAPRGHLAMMIDEDFGELLVYGDIGDDWFGGVTARQVVEQLDAAKKEGVRDLTVRINSAGGLVDEGLAIYNALAQEKRISITTQVDGYALSSASIIAMAGDTIRIAENAAMMIHNPWSLAIGNASELRAAADVLDKMTDSLVGIYTARTGNDESVIREMMDAETWMLGNEAVDAMFATEAIPNVQAEDEEREAMARSKAAAINAKLRIARA